MLFQAKEKILFIGDSIGDYDRARPYGDCANNWGTSYISDIGTLLQATYPEKLFHIYNVCTSGNQSRDLAMRWQEDVMDLKPDWVCMLIGINDVWRQFDCPERPETHVSPEDYEKTLDKLIAQTLPVVHGMVLMTPYFMEQNKDDAMRKRMDEYGEIVKKLGKEYGCLTIDLQATWDAFYKSVHPHSITWDMIHPGPVGRKVLARAFLKAVGYEW